MVDEIVTPRLRLRRARLEDAGPLHAVFSDPQAMAYWSTLPHETLEQTQDWVASMIAAPADESDDFVIEYEGRAVGKAGCWRLPAIGYILRRDLWGKGLVREALEAVIAHLFATRDIDRLTADVDPRNERSLALLERLGFERTGYVEKTWLIGEEWCDSVYLALERSSVGSGR